MLANMGRWMVLMMARFGGCARFTASVLVAIALGWRSWGRWSRLGAQLFSIGSRSAPVLALTGAFIGAILAIELYPQMSSLGQEESLGAVVNVSLLRQIGPVIAGLMLAGRVGCSLTAELGSMNVTQQLDAMRMMAADPVRVLAAPRVVACVAMIPILTIVSNICGIGGGWLVATRFYGISPEAFWRWSDYYIDWFEIMNGLVKSVFFGAAIGIIACFKGFTCRPGAQGVGRATTEGFVASFVSIVLINLVLAKLLNDVNEWRLALRFGSGS